MTMKTIFQRYLRDVEMVLLFYIDLMLMEYLSYVLRNLLLSTEYSF